MLEPMLVADRIISEVNEMSVAHIIVQFNQCTRADLVLLECESRKARLKKYSEFIKERWDGLNYDIDLQVLN